MDAINANVQTFPEGGNFEPVAEEAAPNYTAEQMRALKQVADDLQLLNLSVVKAVEAGFTVELMRVSRYHGLAGGWGDQSVPIIT
ncbi:MAG: hypothetical protein QGH73_13230 [Rhodospirillales bacterium]|jgi:hypothetical protein|nr:hypothetical protein [Rhodospirillaceae bacterium]MDP6429537.1 hypothetical protein [Rhodospirillales bacterium]MDP6646599.1 hypothetical protein [Rhodospirillales bacterium]MDP6842633.1 hypothetical protein [Rhodospirillales bacterium]|tara:strand:+ start:846 stop:1100 length:255 start_codon:yes stop_codon:yes gene_type:complete